MEYDGIIWLDLLKIGVPFQTVPELRRIIGPKIGFITLVGWRSNHQIRPPVCGWNIVIEPLLVGGLEHEFYDFPFSWNFIIPTDELIFFRGVGIPPTRLCWPLKTFVFPEVLIFLHVFWLKHVKTPDFPEVLPVFLLKDVEAPKTSWDRHFAGRTWQRRTTSCKRHGRWNFAPSTLWI